MYTYMRTYTCSNARPAGRPSTPPNDNTEWLNVAAPAATAVNAIAVGVAAAVGAAVANAATLLSLLLYCCSC